MRYDRLHLKGTKLAARVLDTEKMSRVGRFGPFEGDSLPKGWTADPRWGRWWVEDGCIHASVSGADPAVLWFDTELRGSHAVRFVGSVVAGDEDPADRAARNGNLNCIWGSRGRVSGDDYVLTLSGFGGWYSGLAGIEVMAGPAAKASNGDAVCRTVRLESNRTYEIIAGRLDQSDFYFIDGHLVMALDFAGELTSGSEVALATHGAPDTEIHVKFEAVEVFEIPEDAVVLEPY